VRSSSARQPGWTADKTARRSGAPHAIDDLYLSEMAESSVLTAPQELEIGERIASAEQDLVRALVSSHAGAEGLAELGADLADKRRSIRELLLNPDQSDLDLDATSDIMRDAMTSAGSHEADVRDRAAEAIARARLDDAVMAELVERVRASAEAAPADGGEQHALRAIDDALLAIEQAKARLVTGNLRLVVLFARKYLGRGVALLDLVQEGNLGLLRAADKFDHRRGFRFSTYAAWWIKQSLQRALLDRTVRLPVHVADDRRRILKLRAAFVAQHEREPSVEEISALSNLGRDRVENILTLPPQPSSLDIPVGEDGDARLVDLVASNAPLPDQTAALSALGSHMEQLLGELDERERQILRLRFGLDHSREHTLEEVGKILHLTRERIRQIEQSALAKLKSLACDRNLESYLEE
jgi:RNA polymerase primary sigma factor